MSKINFILTILVTVLEFSVGIFDLSVGKIFWGITFILIGIFYIFVMIPMTYKSYLRDKAIKAKMNEVRKLIEEKRRLGIL